MPRPSDLVRSPVARAAAGAMALALAEIHRRGVSILLVEQNTAMALAVADRGYVLESGLVVLAGSAAALAGDDRVRSAYLGL